MRPTGARTALRWARPACAAWLGLCLLALLGAAPAHAAATLTLTPGTDPVEDLALNIGVSGTSTVPGRGVYVDVASGDTACGATWAADNGTPILSYNPGSSPFTNTAHYTPPSPGTYTLCGYVTQSYSATPDATYRTTFTARQNPNSPPGTGQGSSQTDVVATPEVRFPDDGAKGEQINPTFTWTADPLRGASLDRLRLQIDERDGTTTNMIDVTPETSTSYLDDAGEYDAKGTSIETSELASFTVKDGLVRVRLNRPLPPGRYSWFVARFPFEDFDGTPVYSGSRALTVLGPRLKRLSLSTSSQRGSQSRYPGSTRITARTTPYAKVRLTLRRMGRRSTSFFRTGQDGTASVSLDWSCLRPGGRYRVTAVASDQYGTRRSVRSSFRPVSRARCRAMRRAEAAARRARERRRAAEQRAAERRAARRHAERIRRYKRTCIAIGGTPRLILAKDGWYYWVCVAPFGGLLNVP